MRKATVVIPSRYQSSRFPGKPLVPILGKPMLQWVYAGVCRANWVDRILIATDDGRIKQAAQGFGAEVVMTSARHKTGTDRVAEVASQLESPLILNVQGDEPLIEGEMVDSLVRVLQEEDVPMASLMARIDDEELVRSPDVVKVVVDKHGFALYFSRAPLPFGGRDFFFQHIGCYGFKRDFLFEFVRMNRSRLEEIEKLEQLRALENGHKIRMVEVARPLLSVDTPEDIIKVENLLRERRNG